MAEAFPRPTKTYRAKPYPAISPSRPELNLKGQTVLITGGATGIGLETTNAFAEAGVAKIVLLARTEGPMIETKNRIQSKFPGTQVDVHAVSITKFEKIDQIVKDTGIIDILVLNAAALHKFTPALQLNNEDIRTAFDVNVFGPMNLIKAFMNLPPRDSKTPRTIIFTSAWSVSHVFHGVGGYSASKSAMTYFMRCIDEENTDPNLRTFAFHPAVAYTPIVQNSLGLGPDSMPYDDPALPAHFAVWLCSPEADYLKGRFLSANWDVDELKAKKDLITQNPELLKVVASMEGIRN